VVGKVARQKAGCRRGDAASRSKAPAATTSPGGLVAVTAGFRIQHIGGGRLTVVSGDELGVERVEVYELR